MVVLYGSRRFVWVGRCLAVAAAALALAPGLAQAQTSNVAAPWQKSSLRGSRTGGGMFLRVDHLMLPRGEVHRTRADVGVVIRPLDRLAFDLGMGIGGGRMRRLDGPDTVVDFGANLDARFFLTPYNTVQVFLLGGVGLGALNGSLRTRAPAPGEDCPGDGMFYFDVSAGLGAEVALGRTTSLVFSGRVLRREGFLGDLTFAASRVNPPIEATQNLVGAAFGLSLVGYLQP